MMLSAIIPTRNRNKLLSECLDSLLRQEFDEKDYEIIVVDDGSKGGTHWILKQLGGQHPNIRYVRQDGGGPAKARNRGLKMAEGDIIAFLDDDCIVGSKWASMMVEYHRNLPEADGIAGRILPAGSNIISEFSLSLEDRASLTKVEFFKSSLINNTSYKRRVFEIMRLDESFSTAAAEDVEFNYRLFKEGFRVMFAPNVIATHHYPKTLATLVRQQFRFGRGRIRLIRKAEDYPFDKSNRIVYIIKRIATPFFDPFLRLRYAISKKKRRPILYLILGYIQQTAYWSGFAYGLLLDR